APCGPQKYPKKRGSAELGLVIGMPISKIHAQPLETPRPLDVFLLLDQSGSMRWTDPENIRLEAARYFTKYLAAFYTDIFDHHLGLINFGTTAPVEAMVPLMPLDRQAISSIESKIVPLDLGDTSFINALQLAVQSFASAEEGRERAVVIFTDGEPDDPRKLSKEAYFKEIKEFVAKNMAEVSLYVVAVDVEGKYWPEDKQFWGEITRGRIFGLPSVKEAELDKIYSTILLELLRIPELHWDEVPEEGLEVKIDPYLEKVTFSVLKERAEVEFSLIRGDGEKVRPEDPDVAYSSGRLFEIYAISEPAPGMWKYTITKGRGRVEVGRAFIRVEAKLLQPLSPYPQGKTMELLASFRKRDGSPIKELPAYPLWMGARVIKPGVQKFLSSSRR
ncbi:vWA domain-containing protein, partial [Candidatus Hakubella thermalkaliphila]